MIHSYLSTILMLSLSTACFLSSIRSAQAQDKKLTSEELIARHLDSIGTAEARSKASTRVASGETKFLARLGGSANVDGQAMKACQLPASAAVGKRITTIEGLSNNSSHPVQQAWVEIGVPQCGYCQSGQIMAAAALVAKRKNPTLAEIEAAMADNLCRCGTYQRIVQAIRRASELAQA